MSAEPIQGKHYWFVMWHGMAINLELDHRQGKPQERRKRSLRQAGRQLGHAAD